MSESEQEMGLERLNKKYTILLLLILGVALVFLRLLYLHFPVSFLFDALLYALAGYFAGNRLYYKRWRWGVLLSLPAMLVILYFFFSASEYVDTGSGLRNIISFVVIPASACAGIWIKNNLKKLHST